MAIKNPTTASSCDVTHPKDLDSSTDPDPRGVPARADGLRPPDRGRGRLHPLRAAAAGHRAAGPPRAAAEDNVATSTQVGSHRTAAQIDLLVLVLLDRCSAVSYKVNEIFAVSQRSVKVPIFLQ